MRNLSKLIICEICGNEFLGMPNGMYCPDCKRALTTKRIYEWSCYGSRGCDFDLTFDEFWKIRDVGECHYCGYVGKVGIDRKDSKFGYTVDNCVPSCWTCNMKKNSTPYDDFIDWCRRISDRFPR